MTLTDKCVTCRRIKLNAGGLKNLKGFEISLSIIILVFQKVTE